jgi:SagB-type dehydrogenase family enzyme
VAKKDPGEVVLEYHEQTKHHYHRFARSLGYLDWDNQPNPFRRFEGAPVLELPLMTVVDSPSYAEVFQAHRTPEPVNIVSISRLFRNSLAISAWKRYQESRWALRVNPSSGNLHPTEGYAILSGVGASPGIFHYASEIHALEQRATLSASTFDELTAGFPAGSFFVGFTSIHWREAWKYGERAYRYCQHDLGHAMAAMRISAAVLGWQMTVLDELADLDVASLLGLLRTPDFHEAEDESTGCVAVIVPSLEPISIDAGISQKAIQLVANSEWTGRANRLSISHVEWQSIEEAALATAKNATKINQSLEYAGGDTFFLPFHHYISAEKIIQQRRSAVAMDGFNSISREVFLSMLSRVMPDSRRPPFDALARSEIGTPRIHLALFVLRVEGIDPGLYLLVRNPQALPRWKENTHAHFLWEPVDGGSLNLPLYCLQKGNFERIAASVSCGQDIAGDGAFSLGMIAEFAEPLTGPWLYPRLFWETGVIGQILYLEAEAAAIRSTGIGCFFDDPMHELLGIKGKEFQSLYHFTVGGPVEDPRITSEPAYGVIATQERVSNPDLP